MKNKFLLSLLLLSAVAAAVTPLQAASHRCSNATAAGQWAYSYTGSIFTASGWVPAAAVRPLSSGCSG